MNFKKRNLILVKSTETPQFFRGTDTAYLITTQSYLIKQVTSTNTFLIRENDTLAPVSKIFYLEKRDHLADIYNSLQCSTVDKMQFMGYNDVLNCGFSSPELNEAISRLRLVRCRNGVTKLNLKDVVDICKFYKSLKVIWTSMGPSILNLADGNKTIGFDVYLKNELSIYSPEIKNWAIENVDSEFADFILEYCESGETSCKFKFFDDFYRVVLKNGKLKIGEKDAN